MWICKTCNEQNEDNFEQCFNCGTYADGSTSENTEEINKMKNDIEDTYVESDETEYVTTYGTTRFISQVVAVIGWVIIIFSATILLVSISKLAQSRHGLEVLSLFPSIGGIISGLLLVILGQLTRATVDNADNTGEILELLRNNASE